MKRIYGTCAALALAAGTAASASAASSAPHAAVIYGSDDRLDVYQEENALMRSLADSTVALFQSDAVRAKDGLAQLTTQSYGEALNLCKEEPFYEQGKGAFCSGSLVAPDIIMTAGHCVRSLGSARRSSSSSASR